MSAELQSDLGGMIEPVARLLLGDPNERLSGGGELRFGANGSLAVHVSGDHRGTWRDHEAGAGGGVLDLIIHRQGGDRKQAAQWLREHTGNGASESGRTIAATYPYVDAHGDLIFEVVRFEPKEFRQRRPDGKGGFAWNVKGVAPTLYRMPQVLEAVRSGARIFIVEGEKDADRLASAGIVATCNPGGAGKWKPQLSELLSGAHVAIIPDADEAGKAHAEDVARQLTGLAENVRLIELADQARKEDVSDWLARGGSAEKLAKLADQAPVWRPSFKPRYPIIWFGQEDAVSPLTWLVRGLMVEGGVSVVYGPPKSSKTFLALDLALHVAHGRNWYDLRVKRGGVLYVCGEGVAGVRQRMKAWRQEKGGDTSAPFALVPQSVNLFDTDEELDRLIADIRGLAEPMGEAVSLVVFDTLARMIGSGDEDKARDINVLVRACERIQRETGAHVMIVHHSGKDRDRGMRGSNALLGAVDVAIEVKKDDAGLCEAKVPAIKDGGDIGPFTYTLRQSVVGTDSEGDEIVSCVIDPAGASQGASRLFLSDPERRCLALLREMERDSRDTAGQSSGVPIGTWRDKFRDLENGTFDARKKRAERAVKSIIDKGLAEPWGDRVFATGADQ